MPARPFPTMPPACSPARGILGALYERDPHRQAAGSVEINMLEAAIAFIPDPFANHTQLGDQERSADPRRISSHSFAFRCADGKLARRRTCRRSPNSGRGCSTALSTARAGAGRRASPPARPASRTIVELTQGAGRGRSRPSPRAEWMALLEANDVPFAPVHSIPDVLDDPQVHAPRHVPHPSPIRPKALSPRSAGPSLIDGAREHATDLAAHRPSASTLQRGARRTRL